VALKNEFSRSVLIEPWPEDGIEVRLHADPREREALARRFELLEIAALDGHGRLERTGDGKEIRFNGWLEAEVTQACVVSLEPVTATIREPIERRYLWVAPGEQRAERPEDTDEDVEPLRGSQIDLGEMLAEELALALDPYPRAPDADALVSAAVGPHVSFGAAEPDTPFAGLGQLWDKRAR
jgi:uncharacterized metal-binding protein YceD (DUF177 family)